MNAECSLYGYFYVYYTHILRQTDFVQGIQKSQRLKNACINEYIQHGFDLIEVKYTFILYYKYIILEPKLDHYNIC